MNKLLVLFGLAALAEVVLGGPGLTVRFDVGMNMGEKFFIPVPHNRAMAEEKGWKKYERVTKDRPLLKDMYCGESLTCCVLMDDNGYAGGFQTAYEKSKFKNPVFDWEIQGYTTWKVNVDGVEKEYWVITQYFVSDEYLAYSKEARKQSYDNSQLLQEQYVWFTGFYGKLYKVPVRGDKIPDAGFTEQNCIPWMGHHYYWNMTKDTECTDDNIHPYFPLVKSNRIVGAGSLTAGIMEFDEDETDFCEKPAKAAVQLIVNKGPQCLYDLAEKPGFTTMHVYYVDDPYWITCIFQ